MESGLPMWNCVYDGLSDLTKTIRDQCPGGLTGCAGLTVTFLFTVKYISNFIGTRKTKIKIKDRRDQAEVNIKKIRQGLQNCKEAIDESITQIPFKELQEKLYSGQLTCRQVLRAYQAKALELDDQLNCVTEFIHEAEERACKLDALTPGERGPLHGIPLSLKEAVGVAGQDCTIGLSHLIGQIHKNYGVIAQVLIEQGAIPFVRTNVCQGLVSFCCSNPIYGESRNPLKPDRTCGGSSGGEGALIGGGGSILGIGCDMGGSNRVPAHFCGICGFKSSSERTSNAGNHSLNHDIVLLREVYGPMGRDVDSLAAYMRAVLEPKMSKFDKLLPHIPWRDEVFKNKKPLKIGYYICDGGLEPVPAVKRAVLMAKTVLEKMGHKVVEFTPPDILYNMTEFGVAPFLCDDGKTASTFMKYEVIDRSMADAHKLQTIPYGIRWLLAKLLFFLHPVERALLTAKSAGNVYNFWRKNDAKELVQPTQYYTMPLTFPVAVCQ